MKATTYNDWILSMGSAPAVAAPSSKHLYGWFYLTVVLTTASAVDASLVSQDAWYDDQAVRAAYNCADATTTPMEAHLRLEQYELVVVTDDLAVTAANKVKLLTAAGRPYLYAKPENNDWYGHFVGAISDPVGEFQLNFAAAAAAQHGLLRGTPKRVRGTMTVDLSTEVFKVKTDAGTGVGADLTCLLCLFGAISPQTGARNVQAESFNPSNGASVCARPGGTIQSDRDVALLRNGMFGSYRNANGFAFRGF